jgi:hypothetical protein
VKTRRLKDGKKKDRVKNLGPKGDMMVNSLLLFFLIYAILGVDEASNVETDTHTQKPPT